MSYDLSRLSSYVRFYLTVVKQLAVAASYTHFIYFERDTNGISKNAEYAQPSRGPDAGGVYTQRVGVINVNLEAMF